MRCFWSDLHSIRRAQSSLAAVLISFGSIEHLVRPNHQQRLLAQRQAGVSKSWLHGDTTDGLNRMLGCGVTLEFDLFRTCIVLFERVAWFGCAIVAWASVARGWATTDERIHRLKSKRDAGKVPGVVHLDCFAGAAGAPAGSRLVRNRTIRPASSYES